MSQLPLTQRVHGVVRSFDLSKGYGYITVEGVSDDVFFHYSNIEGEGLRMLSQGEEVSFFIEKNANGQQATRVAPKV